MGNMVNILKNEEFTTMKKLHITKEQFEKSKYFTKKYGTLKFVSESGRLFKTDKGHVLRFDEGMKREVMPMNGRKSFGHKAVEEEDENGTIDGWRVFDYGEEFPYVERYEVLDPDGYPFFIDHNGGVGSFSEDTIEGSSEEVCDALEIEIKDKMYKPRELAEREILDNPVVQKGLKRIKVKFQYEKED